MYNALWISLLLTITNSYCQTNELSITWYGQSCFGIKYNETSIIIDPCDSENLDYDMPEEKFDYGISTHKADDHFAFHKVNVEKKYLACGSEAKFIVLPERENNVFSEYVLVDSVSNEIEIMTFPSFHDDKKGAINGVNGIICMNFGGIRVVHLGDLGHILESDLINSIGRVDVLMIPVDTYYIWEMAYAKAVTRQLNPEIVLPMHYKTSRVKNESYPEDIDEYAIMFKHYLEYNEDTIMLTKEDFGQSQRLIKLDYFRR